jgi:Amt family ammonium transporter
VHGVGGALGSLLVPFMVSIGTGGVPLARSALAQFAVQGEAVVAVGLWSVAATVLIITVVKVTSGWRISRDAEVQGLDFSSHGETGYHNAG